MMDINESITTFNTETAPDHCANGNIPTPEIVAEDMDDMDLLVYSDSEDDGRSKSSLGQMLKPMELIDEGNYNWNSISELILIQICVFRFRSN